MIVPVGLYTYSCSIQERVIHHFVHHEKQVQMILCNNNKEIYQHQITAGDKFGLLHHTPLRLQ